jgi:uncharacterized Tic20 family protein
MGEDTMSYEDLKVLDELRKNGSITEEEYQREKERVFNSAAQPQPQPVYAAPPGPRVAPGAQSLFGMQENTYLMLMHLSQFLGIVIPLLGFAAPIILWALNKDTNPRVDATGKRIFNFIISFVIYAVASSILTILLIGIFLLIALGVCSLVFIIMAAIKANNGEDWNYPLTISFFK